MCEEKNLSIHPNLLSTVTLLLLDNPQKSVDVCSLGIFYVLAFGGTNSPKVPKVEVCHQQSYTYRYPISISQSCMRFSRESGRIGSSSCNILICGMKNFLLLSSCSRKTSEITRRGTIGDRTKHGGGDYLLPNDKTR